MIQRVLFVLMFMPACSEYDVVSKLDTENQAGEEATEETTSPPPVDDADTGEAVEEPSEEDTPEAPDTPDSPVEDPPDDEDTPEDSTEDTPEAPPVVADPPEGSEELFCTEFADFDAWTYAGDGSWGVADGILEEFRGGFYSSIAHTADDLGSTDAFAIQVDVSYAGSLNDLSGIVWGYEEGRNWFGVRWDDPQGDYGRYAPTGAVEIVECNEESCIILAVDSGADTYHPADGSWATWRVYIMDDRVEVLRNGITVMSTTVDRVSGSGIGAVGVYSNDNDGGVFYDNFCAWRLTE